MNTKPRKPRIKVINYEMSFESLEQMVDELITLHPEIKNIFHSDYGDVITPRHLHDEALEYFTLNEPNVVDGSNLPVAISVSSNGVTLKTAKFFSIKWNFKYDRSGFVTDIVATITVFIKDENKIGRALANMIDILDRTWQVVETRR